MKSSQPAYMTFFPFSYVLKSGASEDIKSIHHDPSVLICGEKWTMLPSMFRSSLSDTLGGRLGHTLRAFKGLNQMMK
jgi:hypothetical protein